MSDVTLNEDLVVKVSRLVKDSVDPATENIPLMLYLNLVLKEQVAFTLSNETGLTITSEIQR